MASRDQDPCHSKKSEVPGISSGMESLSSGPLARKPFERLIVVGAFTRSGSDEFEQRLSTFFNEVVSRVRSIFKKSEFLSLILGGGYGRGEGGVFWKDGIEYPYNDFDFYLFASNPPRWNEFRYQKQISQASKDLSQRIGVEVDFKFISLQSLRKQKVTMFFYDLLMGHKILWGDPSLFSSFTYLRDARNIPLSEASRLGMNRSSGLIFAKQKFKKSTPTQDDICFIERNIAKAELAIGDMILTALGLYHWSCLERNKRLHQMDLNFIDHKSEILRLHDEGVRFKLLPKHSLQITHELIQRFQRTSELLKVTWLWLERKRLKINFENIEQYVRWSGNKCPDTAWLKNVLLNLRDFRYSLDWKRFGRYPREHVLNTFPVLLWLDSPERSFEERSVINYQRLWSKYN
jgi:hypothetical protein